MIGFMTFLLFTLLPWSVILWFLYEVGTGVYNRFFRPTKNFKKHGNWALVTGATDGIGKAFAQNFAKRGLNVVILSRTESKLKECQSEIEALGVECRYVAVDFAELTDKSLAEIADCINDLQDNISVWVNNVGMSYPFPEMFGKLSQLDSRKMVAINVNSTSEMSTLAIKMNTRYLVNISSIAATVACPMLAQYSATKAYHDKLSLALHYEEGKEQKTHVQVQNPHFVVSKLSKFRKPTLTVPTPENYVAAAVRAIGYEAQTSPYWVHGAISWIMNRLPYSMQGKISLSMHKGVRARAYKKLGRKQISQ